MATKGPFGFIGGWHTKASTTTLPPNCMPDAQNINIIYGDAVKRKGSKSINSSAISGTPAIHGLTEWQTNAGQRYQIITAGTKVFQTADLGSTFTDITGSSTVTAGQNNQHTFSSLNNILIICGGATPDTPLQWTGSGNVSSLAGSPPAGNLTAVANNFAFISGVAATPSRIFWSNVIDPGTWSSTSYVDFRASDGDRVTAMVEMNQNLIIFKRRSIGQLWTIPPSAVSTPTLGPLTQILAGIGCAGGQAVDKLFDGRIVFLGSNAHVYIFDGQTLQDISDKPLDKGSIQPTLDAINQARLQYSVVKYYPTKNEIWISVSEGTSTTHNAIYVYSLTYDCWESKFTGIAANVMTNTFDTRSAPAKPIIMLTGNYGGFVYEQDTGNTNAEDTNLVIDGYGTVSLFVGVDATEFIPKFALVPIESNGNTNLQLNYGFNGYTETPNSVNIPQSGQGGLLDQFVLNVDVLGNTATLMKKVQIYSTGRVNSVQVQFRNQQSGQDFTVHPFFLSEEVLT